MGLDGGTKISRSDVLRGASWRLLNADTSRSTRGGCVSTSRVLEVETAEKATDREAKLSSCHLSGEPLLPPLQLAADYLGNIYNRASLVEFLLAGQHGSYTDADAETRYANILRTNGANLKHIKRQRDTIQIHITAANQPSVSRPAAELIAGSPTSAACAKARTSSSCPTPSATEFAARAHASGVPAPAEASGSRGLADLVCPVSQLPFATAECCVIAPCGHVYARRGLQRILTDAAPVCAVCELPFDARFDVVQLLPSHEVLLRQKQLISERRKHRKALQIAPHDGTANCIEGGVGVAATQPAKRARLMDS